MQWIIFGLLVAKLVVDAICGILDALGGYHWLFCRRYIMIFVLAVCASLLAMDPTGHHAYWAGLVILPAMGAETLGYFSGDRWCRGLWLFIQAAAIDVIVTVLGFVYWQWALFCLIAAGIYGFAYKDWQQKKGDFGAGAVLALIIFGFKHLLAAFGIHI